MTVSRDLQITAPRNQSLSILSSSHLSSSETIHSHETVEQNPQIVALAQLTAWIDEAEVPPPEGIDAELETEGIGADDPVRIYLREIGRVHLLTAQEEMQIAQQIECGEEAAIRLNNHDFNMSEQLHLQHRKLSLIHI